jgi:hypothetical protein
MGGKDGRGEIIFCRHRGISICFEQHLYYTGQGVSQDLVLSYTWFNLAAANIEYSAKDREAASRNGDIVTRNRILLMVK